MANKRRPRTLANLWSITQGLNETLESYTKRFITAYSCVMNLNEDFAIQAFTIGVTSENVQYALYGTNVVDMKGLIAKAQKLSETEQVKLSRTGQS